MTTGLCQNQSNLLGEDLTQIDPGLIIIDQFGYGYTREELNAISSRFSRNPYTTLPWDRHYQITPEGHKPLVTLDPNQRVEADGTQKWYLNGQLHRDGDQPAVIDADGTKEWWRNNEQIRSFDHLTI